MHLKPAGEVPLLRVTVVGVGADWFEETGTNYARQPGGASFRHRRHTDLAWSIDRLGGDLRHVILGNSGTTWEMADASAPDPEGWQHISVDPKVVAARAAGLSYGFLVFDDTGSEWTRDGERFTFHLFPNRFVFSRDQKHIDRFIGELSYGGGGANLVNVHLFVETMPFGGTGSAGMGHYYGKYGFDALTHAKSMLVSPPDVAIEHLYSPFTDEKNKALQGWFEY